MEYAIITIANGTVSVKAEHITSLDNAKVNFHEWCKVFWNATDVKNGAVMLCDNNLHVVNSYLEIITHKDSDN